jgi:predicted 3-demethylubiquinone-9 3-methyltransferase (glyoxalase superfamily)
MIPRIQPCLWFNGDGEAAASFYAATFPDTRIDSIGRAPSDYPSGRQGDPLTIQMTICGQPVMLLNAGPQFPQTEAFSFVVATEDQAETDRLWAAITGNGGAESACGWCKDRWGLSWQITPSRLLEYMSAGGETAKRAFGAMMTMRKIDIAALDAAVAGDLSDA